MTSNELKRALDLWSEIFANDDTALVVFAVKSLIQTLEFPPTIADVKKEMAKLVDTASDEDLAIDEWNAIKKAIGNSMYNAGEMFDNLPEIAKRFVGSPKQLRDWGMMCDFNSDVIRGQFLKQYEVLKERKKYSDMLNSNPQLQTLLNKVNSRLLTESKEVNNGEAL